MNRELIKDWKKALDEGCILPCPRCGGQMEKKHCYHALSRKADISICSNCGSEEAIEAYAGVPGKEWYVDRKTKEDGILIFEEGAAILAGSFILLYLSIEDIDDIMCSVLEGGITYWCSNATVGESEYYGEYAHEQIARQGSLILYDAEEETNYTLTLEKLVTGIKEAIKEGYVRDLIEDRRIDTCRVDGEVADIITQFALFGEVIYG